MTTDKKSMYEILEVSPTATIAEIKAAHKRLSISLMAGKSGISREDINFKLNLLDVALHTISVPVLRDAYDAKLASALAPKNAVLPIKGNAMSLVDSAKTSQIVAAIVDSQKHATAAIQTHQFPIKEVTTTVKMSIRSLKAILRVVIGLLILGFVIRIGQAAVAHRNAGQPTSDELKAEDKLVILEYYKKHGVRPASRAEADLLEKEYSRKEKELHAAKTEAQRKDDEYNRFVEESRREGEYIHQELVRSEEYAREQEEQRQRAEAEKQRYQKEAAQRAEDIRIANERRKLGLKPIPNSEEATYAGDSE